MTAALDMRLGYWPADEPFPVLLTPAQLRRVFGDETGPMSEATYYRLRKLGRFARFEVDDVAGVRYSGDLVRRYTLNQPTHAYIFGATRRGARTA